MKYLTPEIEALTKNKKTKRLARPNISCGIFQDCDYNYKPKPIYNKIKL